jgi:7,8-dihydro-6-hydroxymethylpterin-pyrophosphokinase
MAVQTERYFILLGSNIGDREQALHEAKKRLALALGEPDRVSGIY